MSSQSTILTTPRLRLRCFQPQDALGFFRMNQSADVRRFTGDSPFESVEAATNFLKNYRYQFLPDCPLPIGRYAMIERSGGNFVGFCGPKLHTGGVIDLGYRVSPAYRMLGYATEAAQAVLSLLRDRHGLRPILRIYPENIASIRVAEKLGMKFLEEDEREGRVWMIFR